MIKRLASSSAGSVLWSAPKEVAPLFRDVSVTNSEEDASHKDESHIQDDGDSAETIYEDELERQWGEAQSIQGLDPSLLSKRRRRDYAGR